MEMGTSKRSSATTPAPDRSGGMGPRFHYDLAALRDAYIVGCITHEEFRRNAREKLGLSLDEWPTDVPRPLALWEQEMLRYGIDPRVGEDSIAARMQFAPEPDEQAPPPVPHFPLAKGWLTTDPEED